MTVRALRLVRRLSFLRGSTLADYAQPVPNPNDQIVVSMSSGVDSSVAALMYAKQYKNVKGIFMANWSPDSRGGVSKCTVESDWEEVQTICDQIGIPCERVNFEKEYWSDVFEPMLEMYRKGLTPNPDVGCNKYVKFGKMIEHLSTKFSRDNWWLVTGHYARIMKHRATGESHLLRAGFLPKDQSYYLSQMPESVLSKILMPIGHYTKPEVRELAQRYGLVSKDKRDSQGLCFVSQHGNFKDFLDEFLPPNPGDIVTADGRVWGRHNGLWHGTIGQRSGISLPQGDPEMKGVWYISGKNYDKNQLIISKKTDRAAFEKDRLKVADWQWINSSLDFGDLDPAELTIQVRSLESPRALRAVVAGNEPEFLLQEKIDGVAPGQNLVLYKNERVLGGGIIAEAN
ncbi:hypothetical protein KL918_003563 [Ogataea parapolymorpha]|uniref:tRNA-5-taurinomethyluridine 2-sulfurtransferase n=1 Tax=Ogataea parapolymorpha (strain ATCC 26012 / BCRC 20466 / JCM 22074 / NRRL Y-7560 / DL-1) TaxID=871575 RepID=W1Q7Q1_OGAPD|nr:Mitochondrial tRNA-specific 2-thiouridylase 1 [Ogataea parapolymorpha DL-1]ESW96002.1 Mitochondrial tRNA-specific 2-thiouridylase 1 [Ogataea parapolymorpha DL-1]KAG7866666.1 hypothetical protein KL918_003563 [Ogataea parapolymorpha]KAG7870648.1 hypothetical protein KL916_004853 [Ogataea parapolymorpha]